MTIATKKDSINCKYCGFIFYVRQDSTALFELMSKHWTNCSGIPKIDQLELWEQNGLLVMSFLEVIEILEEGAGGVPREAKDFWKQKLKRIKKHW